MTIQRIPFSSIFSIQNLNKVGLLCQKLYFRRKYPFLGHPIHIFFLKGVQSQNGYKLTDPVIHSATWMFQKTFTDCGRKWNDGCFESP